MMNNDEFKALKFKSPIKIVLSVNIMDKALKTVNTV